MSDAPITPTPATPSGGGHWPGFRRHAAVSYPSDTHVNITRDKDGLITTAVDAPGMTTNVYYPSQWLKTMAEAQRRVWPRPLRTLPAGCIFVFSLVRVGKH